MALWDLRIDRRIMKIMDSSALTEGITKAKFLSNNYLICASGPTLATFDLRSPAIILSSLLTSTSASEDLNDLDLTQDQDGRVLVTTCDDSGEAQVYHLKED